MKRFQVSSDEENLSSALQGERLSNRAGWTGRSLFGLILAGLFLAIIAALIPRLQFFIENINRWLTYPYFQAGSEGLMLSEAAIVKAGGSLYVPLRPDLFISAPYPPLYYYLLAALWPQAGDASAGFTTGRTISLVSALVAALFIGLLVMADSRPLKRTTYFWAGLVGGLAGLTFLSMPAVTVWAVRVRADMLMVALQLIALTLIGWRPKGWPAFVAILPLTLAFYTKHTGLAAPAAATLYLIVQNWPNRKRILAWVLGLGGAIGLPFLILNLITGLEFYRRLFPYHDLGRDDRNLERYLSLFWQENAALLILAGLYLGFWILDFGLNFAPFNQTGLTINGKSKIQNLKSPVPIWGKIQNFPLSGWFLLFSLPLLLGMGVVGTDHNHFLPGEAATCAFAATICRRLYNFGIKGVRNTKFTAESVGVQPATRNGQLTSALPWLLLVGLTGFWVQLAVCAIPAQRYEIEFRARPADYQRQLGQIVKAVAAQPQPILSSEAAFLVLTNRSADHYYYNDMFTIYALARQGRYNLDGMIQAIREHKFGYILAEGDFFSDQQVRADVWPPPVVEAIKQYYKVKFRDVWFIYEPKN